MKRRQQNDDPTPAQNFRETLKEAGIPESHLEAVARELERAAAAHLKLNQKGLSKPLSATEARGLEAVEAWCQHVTKDYPGITGLRFMSDPRGETVALQLASGAYNSLTGGWKVPVSEEDLGNLRRGFSNRYIDAVDELKTQAPSLEPADIEVQP